MKYIIDLDALKDCMNLLRRASSDYGQVSVYLADIKELIDSFPKEQYTDKTLKEREV